MPWRFRPDIAFKGAQRQQIEAVELDIAKTAFANMPGEHPGTRIVGRRLSKFARTGDVAAADVEPITGEPPIGNCVHLTPPSEHRGIARCTGLFDVLMEERATMTQGSDKIGLGSA
jgi:hypothetical protein